MSTKSASASCDNALYNPSVLGTFVSKEASTHLKPHLESLESGDLVFATNPNPFHAKMTEIEAFIRTRDRAGLTAKYDSTNRHHITLHSFRSYFFTRARGYMILI